MRISRSLKVMIVALPAGAWLLRSDAGPGRTLAIAAGAVVVTFAWTALNPRRSVVATAASETAATPVCAEYRDSAAEQRIPRPPTGRGARDVRCPASRATTRARRPTRRH